MFWLSLHRLLKRASSLSRRGRRAERRPRAAWFRPRLEYLEDRTLPSTVNWVGGSGDWSVANNWTDASTLTHHVPTASDDAVINVANITVTHSTGTDQVQSVTISTGTLNL